MVLYQDAHFQIQKNPDMLKYLFKSYGNKDAIVLDFFAGSGTTGQAVLELNKEDGGHRQFILCTNNEKDDINVNGIAIDVTCERLKRVMTGETYSGSSDFPWIKKNEAYGDNLEVYDIATVSSLDQSETGPLDVIDETCYDLPPFENISDKFIWIGRNFENNQKTCPEYDADKIFSKDRIKGEDDNV